MSPRDDLEREELRRAAARATACELFGTDSPTESQIRHAADVWWVRAEERFQLRRLRGELLRLQPFALELLADEARLRMHRHAVAAYEVGMSPAEAAEVAPEIDQLLVSIAEERREGTKEVTT